MVPLEASRLARHLAPPEQRLLAEKTRLQSFPAGHRIFMEGDSGDGLYVLIEGSVEIAAMSVPGRQHRLAVMEPGEYFGEMAVFDGGGRSATAVALTPTTVGFVATETVREMLEHTPLLAAALVRDASLRMRDFNRRFLQESLKAERLTLVERLARTIVHDFRNPLNVVGIAADLAAEPAATVDVRRRARDRIRQQVEVMNRMMQELLDFTRGATISAALPRVNLAIVMRDILLELQAEADRRGVHLHAETSFPELELRLDPPRLVRVFTNLADNAFDAMSGRTDATLTLRCVEEPGSVVIEVSDNGPGISPEVLPHVFQPFVTFGKAHGTGLGLAIADRIIAEHGGRITVTSVAGKGATFQISLPRTKPGDTDRVASSSRPRKASVA
jgi:signal transduction histidine kinase